MIKNPGRTCSTDRDCNDEISHQYFQGHCNSKRGALDGYCDKEKGAHKGTCACICKNLWGGEQCDVFNVCNSANDCYGFCKNGGVPSCKNDKCVCSCPSGWSGDRCDQQCNDQNVQTFCKDFCKNGGTPYCHKGNCACNCSGKWGGDTCEEICPDCGCPTYVCDKEECSENLGHTHVAYKDYDPQGSGNEWACLSNFNGDINQWQNSGFKNVCNIKSCAKNPNIDFSCKTKCDPDPDANALCPNGVFCPPSGCCDSTPTLDQCTALMSCDTDPRQAKYYNYNCDYDAFTDGKCTKVDHCQTLANVRWPSNYPNDDRLIVDEFDDLGNPNCPTVANTWDPDFWRKWAVTNKETASFTTENSVPDKMCSELAPNGFWGMPRCRLSHGIWKNLDSVGVCAFDPENDPSGQQARCVPFPNNCFKCDTDLAKMCQAKFPDEFDGACRK